MSNPSTLSSSSQIVRPNPLMFLKSVTTEKWKFLHACDTKHRFGNYGVSQQLWSTQESPISLFFTKELLLHVFGKILLLCAKQPNNIFLHFNCLERCQWATHDHESQSFQCYFCSLTQ